MFMKEITNTQAKEVVVKSEMITLGQFLKLANVISNGGEARFFLSNNKVLVNGEEENRRGRKLYNGFVVVAGHGVFVVKNEC